MGNIFGKKKTYWVPPNKRIEDKIQKISDWKNLEDFTGWQIQNDLKGRDLICKFQDCENLVEVNLSFNGLGNEECNALLIALKGNKTLKRIDLSNNHIHDAGAVLLAQALTPKSGDADSILEELNLRNNAVGPDGAVALSVLLSNKNFKKLCLYWNNIRNKGLRAICMNLPSGPLVPDYLVDLRNNGFFRADPTAGQETPDGGESSEDPWEQLEAKIRSSRLTFASEVPEKDRQFLGWPEKE